jgi:glycerol uptake facilitator-like aquaporin
VSAAQFDLPRRLLAEGLGTAFLLATVVGSGIMAERLADGNVALALLANAIPTGAILVVLITVFGPISGAHFNPAVTLCCFMRRAIVAPDALAYVAAQLVGGAFGTWCAHLMFDMPILMIGSTVRAGVGQWVGEAVATFGLVAVILACVRFRPKAVAAMVGLYITAAYWFTSSTSFANPAVTVARALTDSFAGIRPADVPAFIFAQLAGALAASVVAGWLFAEPDGQVRQGGFLCWQRSGSTVSPDLGGGDQEYQGE